jgi:hypothetical protein
VYNSSLNLVLVTPSYPSGLCVQAPSVAGVSVRLQPCRSPAVFEQQWSLNNVRAFEGTSNGRTTNGFCIVVRGAALEVARGTSDRQTSPCHQSSSAFDPDATVGAGAAGVASAQLVNYGEFGRCLDLDNLRVDRNLLVFPCKQTPDPSLVAWNQKFTLPPGGTGPITMTTGGGARYCLTAPASDLTPVRITVTACPDETLPTATAWTVRRPTESLTERYRIEDSRGRCLSSSDEAGPSRSHVAVLAPCDGSKVQKWNASPAMLNASLLDVAER